MPDEIKTLEVSWKWLIGCASFLIAIMSAAFGVGIARSKVAMKSELYNKDGSQIYVPRSEFKEVADKVDTMNHTLGRIEQFMEERMK